MANKLNIFKGTDWIDGDILYADDLIEAHENNADLASVGNAELAYQVIKQANSFDNGDFLAADEFTDSTGTNNTVNTGSSTAYYDSDNDQYISNISGDGVDDTDNASTTWDSSPSITISRGYRIQANNNCVLKTVTRASGCTATRCRLFTDGGTLIASTTTLATDTFTFATPPIMISGVYYKLELDASGATYTSRSNSSPSFPYSGVNIDFTERSIAQVSSGTSNADNITSCVTQTGEYDSSSTVVCDSNLKTLDGTEKSICIYADKTTPTNSSMTVDISDGTTTLSAQSFNTAIGLTGFSSGTLKLTFNLNSTDTSVTPSLLGYGVYIK